MSVILISQKWPNLASRLAKLGLTMVQKNKDLFGIIFWAKNSDFEISTIFDHMVFVQYYFPKTSLVTQIGSDFKITKFLSQICL